MKKLITQMLDTFPTSILTIERATEVTNEIWERTKSWSNLYSNIKCIFSLRNQSWSENEWWGKFNINANFTVRFSINDIWNNINNVSVDNRVNIAWITYKIEFIHSIAEDHAIFYLNRFD